MAVGRLCIFGIQNDERRRYEKDYDVARGCNLPTYQDRAK